MDACELFKISGGLVLENEPMKMHTTFRVGGKADFFVVPKDTTHLRALLSFLGANNTKYFIIGNGSNLLVSDRGYRGVIISLVGNGSGGFSQMALIGSDDSGIEVEAGAGCLLSDVSRYLASIGAAGLEALSGIPGSMGGASVMNAGAYGTEMKDVVTACEILDRDLNQSWLFRDDLSFRYRGSKLMDEKFIVTKVRIRLRKGVPRKIEALNAEYMQKRKEKQPLMYPSAGSTFKRPKGFFAGKLISDAGLRGFSIGGAKVSEKHAGFLINKGDATASDIYKLIFYCQKVVFEKSGVILEPEVCFLGDFSN